MKIIKLLMLAVLLASLGAVVYMYYSASDACRRLAYISNDVVVNESLKHELSEYLRKNKVQSFLEKTSGEVFSLKNIGAPFPYIYSIEGLEAHNRNIQLVIKTDRSDKSFRFPYNIKEVGVGYARAYLMFTNEFKSVSGDGMEEIDLRSDSYVDCRTYDN